MSYAGVARRTVRPEPNVAGPPVERRDSNVAGAATSDAGAADRSVVRNPYVVGAAAGAAAAGVYTDCEQTTDDYGNVYTQC